MGPNPERPELNPYSFNHPIADDKWQRYVDKEVLPLTPGGFDSVNQSYPAVIDMGSQLWMFYVGNDFGGNRPCDPR